MTLTCQTLADSNPNLENSSNQISNNNSNNNNNNNKESGSARCPVPSGASGATRGRWEGHVTSARQPPIPNRRWKRSTWPPGGRPAAAHRISHLRYRLKVESGRSELMRVARWAGPAEPDPPPLLPPSAPAAPAHPPAS